jgi:hypothetical protein
VLRRPLLAVAVVLLIAACGSPSPAATDTPASPSSTNPYGAAVIDALGPDEPVLTITGGSAGTVELTMDELEELGTQTVTVAEPFVKRTETFTGVPLSAIMDRAGIASTATINTVALNDYEYAAPLVDLEASDAIIAMKRGDQPIPYDQGGPVRLIFPDGTPLAGVLDAWNWSLSSIEVVSS